MEHSRHSPAASREDRIAGHGRGAGEMAPSSHRRGRAAAVLLAFAAALALLLGGGGVSEAQQSDTTAPTFESATVEGTSLVITFSEVLASTSTPNSAFTVERTRDGVEAAATLSNTAPVISGKTVTLTLTSAIRLTDTDVKVSYTIPTSNWLKDPSNNKTASFTDQPVTVTGVLVSNVGQTEAASVRFSFDDAAQEFTTGATSYTLTSIDLRLITGTGTPAVPTVKVFSGSATGTEVATLSGPSSLDASTIKNYRFTASGVTLSPSTKYWVVAEGTDATGWTTTASNAEDEGGVSDWSIADVGQSRGRTSTGSFSNLSNGRSFQMRVRGETVDTTAPTFASATVEGTSLVITFSEVLASTSTPNSAFTVERTRDGVEATATLSNTAPVISGKTVTLTLASAAAILGTDTDVKVSYTKPTSNGLKDPSNNETASFTDQPVTNNTGILVSNIGQTGTFSVSFNINDAAQEFTTGAGSYTLTSIELRLLTDPGTRAVPTVKVFSGSATGTEVATLSGPSSLDNTSTIKNYTFTASGVTLSPSTKYWVVAEGIGNAAWRTTASDAKDAGGASDWSIANVGQTRIYKATGPFSDLVSGQALQMRVRGETVADTTAPTVASATVEGTSLVITFSEVLASTSTPNSAFTVERTRDGVETTATLSNTAPVISGKTLTLASAAAIIGTDTNVKVSYTKPSNNGLKDPSNNETVSFTDQPVTVTGVLVSNVGQTGTFSVRFDAFDAAQEFTTGAGSYTLTSIDLRLITGTGTRAVPTVKVFSGLGMGTEVATLSGPSSLDNTSTIKNYTFTASGVTLSPSTKYRVVAESTDSSAWRTTASDAEDAGGASDWSIADVGQSRIYNASGPFSDLVSGQALQMRVRGEADTTAPTVESATVEGTSLVITFSEVLASTSTPNSAFTVERTRDGVEATATLSNTAPAISDKTVKLTLASDSAIQVTDTDVKVSYTKPSSNGLKDAADNETASFTDQPVTVISSVLVSNVGQTEASSVSFNINDAAQEFTTGATSYTLTSIELRLITESAPAVPTVKVFSGSATGTEVATLSGPTSLDASTTKN